MAALLVLVASCADDDGDPTAYVALADLPAAYHEARCEHLVRCGLFPDQATCVASPQDPTYWLDPNVVAAVELGRVRYNGSNVKACLASIAAQGCDKTTYANRAMPYACTQFFAGTQPAEAACTLSVECISLDCATDGSPCAQGRCAGDTPPPIDPPALGEPCLAAPGACERGTYCDFTSERCEPQKTEGMPCLGHRECVEGLGCSGSFDSYACKPLPAEGEPCSEPICRDEGNYCNTALATPVCMQYALPPSSCAAAQCSGYYRCDPDTTTCVEGPRLGESCGMFGRCADANAYCHPIELVCKPLLADGQPCTESSACASGNCDLAAATPTCMPQPFCF